MKKSKNHNDINPKKTYFSSALCVLFALILIVLFLSGMFYFFISFIYQHSGDI
ncbi:MAG: hypothetical protein IKJ68_02855 [Clostridia bacterium]|nr:hypothetical protein [Clostridia bacterium]